MKIKAKRKSSHSSTSTSIIAWITASCAFFLNVFFLQWGGGTFGKLPMALILLHWFAIDCKPKISPKKRDQGFFPTTLQIKKPKVAYNKPTWQLWLYGVCNSFQVSMWLAQLCAINQCNGTWEMQSRQGDMQLSACCEIQCIWRAISCGELTGFVTICA